MLFAVGAGSQVVGVSSYDDFPAEAKALPRIGALLDPDVERILSLRPDLVITYGSQIALEAQLGRAGIRIFSYRNGGIATILQTLRDIGRVTGHAAQGDRQAKEIEGTAQRDPREGQGTAASANAPCLRPAGRDAPSRCMSQAGRDFSTRCSRSPGARTRLPTCAVNRCSRRTKCFLWCAPAIVELRATGLFAAGEEKRKGSVVNAAFIPAVRNGRIHMLNGAYLVVARAANCRGGRNPRPRASPRKLSKGEPTRWAGKAAPATTARAARRRPAKYRIA